MTRKEIAKKKAKLDEILKEENPDKRRKDLEELAKIVGASVTRIGKVLVREDIHGGMRYRDENQITETEIVHNIQFALQTETTIEMCRISGRNLWISVIATTITLLAMLAAWAAVAVKARGCVP